MTELGTSLHEAGAISLQRFTDADHDVDLPAYVQALEAFDALPQIQELKVLARHADGLGPGRKVLDVGCGFGLETLRLARLVQPGGRVSGIDKSPAFVAEAKRRAAAAGLQVDVATGDAERLPFPDGTFDVVRAERVLIYLSDPAKALAEIRRVVRPGGSIALIEPDFGTNTINVPHRSLTRRILDHECDANVPQGWLVRDLAAMLEDTGFRQIDLATRVVVFTPELAAGYFGQVGRSAHQADVIDQPELDYWIGTITDLHRTGRLFATIGYFLFTARA